MSSVAVVDLGTGNLRSVQKAIEHVSDPDTRVVVTNNVSELECADRIVLPGQGAIGTCLCAMDAPGMRDTIGLALASKPVLGICLGLQAMYDHSSEGGGARCLGVLSGVVEHFYDGDDVDDGFIDEVTGLPLKVPHMGWNNVRQTQDHPLWHDIEQDDRFYFVHSYRVRSSTPREVFGVTEYGQPFTSAGGKENFFGVQFHPEKSQRAGLQLMHNFVRWDGST